MLNKFEWWDVCRKARPDLTWEQFEVLWANRPAPPADSPN